MSYSKALLDAIPALQNQLPDLLDEESAKILSDHLASLLPKLSPEQQNADLQAMIEIAEDVEEALRGFQATHQWLESFNSQYLEDDRKSFEPLAGNPTSIATKKYMCPKCDYRWSQRSVGQPIPYCPNHPDTKLESRQAFQENP